jgi:hypothetical protein
VRNIDLKVISTTKNSNKLKKPGSGRKNQFYKGYTIEKPSRTWF